MPALIIWRMVLPVLGCVGRRKRGSLHPAGIGCAERTIGAVDAAFVAPQSGVCPRTWTIPVGHRAGSGTKQKPPLVLSQLRSRPSLEAVQNGRSRFA